MIDVFVRLAPDSDLRLHLAYAVVERLCEEPDVRVRHIKRHPCRYSTMDLSGWSIHSVDAADFHRESKALAAELSQSDWLIIVDDDQLPLYKDWVGYAQSLVKRFPDYSAIAGWSVTHEVPRPEGLIQPSDSIGCPMIVRREALLDATLEPITEPQRADTILTQRLQRHGKTGIARNWRYNHLGMGYSQVIPQHWMPACPA